MITVKQAKDLKKGDVIYHVTQRDSKGDPKKFKVNSKPKIWKKAPDSVQFTVKYGLYDVFIVTEEDLEMFSLKEDIIKQADEIIANDDDVLWDVTAEFFPGQIASNIKHTSVFKAAMVEYLGG